MSFDRIAELLTTAQGEPAPTARRLRSSADDLAATSQPEINHPEYGLGVIVGITPTGLVSVTFGGVPFLHEYDPADVYRWAL